MSVKFPAAVRKFLLLMLLLSGGAASEPVVKVGVVPSNYPFTFEQSGELEGFEVELVRAIEARSGITVELVAGQRKDVLVLFDRGELETVAASVELTPQHRAGYTFTQPYIYGGAQIVVRRGDTRIQDVADLRGKVVAVEDDSRYHRWLQTLPFADEITFSTADRRVEDLVATGRADALVTDRIAALRFIAQKPLPLQTAGVVLFGEPGAFPFLKTAESQTLRNRIDDALTELKIDGTVGRISEKWLGGDVTQP